jgi:hypothetical protein
LSQAHKVGYVLTALGIGGILFSFAGEQSDYVDPVAFTLATLSILVAIVGLALAFKLPNKNDHADERVNPQIQETSYQGPVDTAAPQKKGS